MKKNTSIGVFDSGYGGLTILKQLIKELPDYDFVYLGDNARSPYGTKSFEEVYQCTLQSVKYLFNYGCNLIILACNTASAKALRTIQQKDLPLINPSKRVLGVIRPTAEIIQAYTKSNYIGILATQGTVSSQSYLLEIQKTFPNIQVFQQACPMLVPLIEQGQINSNETLAFINQYLNELLIQNSQIDAVVLACTHYPLLMEHFQKAAPNHIKLITQGEIVAKSLKKYLIRHPEINATIGKNSFVEFLTTERTEKFSDLSSLFFEKLIVAKTITF